MTYDLGNNTYIEDGVLYVERPRSVLEDLREGLLWQIDPSLAEYAADVDFHTIVLKELRNPVEVRAERYWNLTVDDDDTPMPTVDDPEFPKVCESYTEGMMIPYAACAMLIEMYGGQPADCTGLFLKSFMERPTAVRLHLGKYKIPVFFMFMEDTKCVSVRFAGAPGFPVETVKALVMRAQSAVKFVKPIMFNFENVQGFNIEDVRRLQKKLEIAVLTDYIKRNREGKVISFNIWAMPSQPGPEGRRKIIEAFKQWYDTSLAVRQCKKCKTIYNGIDQGGCRFHTGERIPFDDGSMEKHDGAFLGQQGERSDIVIFRYSCCGEVPKEHDYGCMAVEDETHAVEKELSSFTYQVQ